MSDRMRPIPFARLMRALREEYEAQGSVFGVHGVFHAGKARSVALFGARLEEPFGPAAGPHTQLAQNLLAAYAAGARFFELKTVQTLDGEDLHVAKPCIVSVREGYNCEWSTELRVQEAMDEYIKAWFALGLLAEPMGLGARDGFAFNMSVDTTMRASPPRKSTRLSKGSRMLPQRRSGRSVPPGRRSTGTMFRASRRRYAIPSRFPRCTAAPPARLNGLRHISSKKKGSTRLSSATRRCWGTVSCVKRSTRWAQTTLSLMIRTSGTI